MALAVLSAVAATCARNSLATKAALVAAQWDPDANDGTPDTVVSQSNQKVGWCRGVCSHKWFATPGQRVSLGTGCPQCARFKKWTRRPSFANHPLLAEWDTNATQFGTTILTAVL